MFQDFHPNWICSGSGENCAVTLENADRLIRPRLAAVAGLHYRQHAAEGGRQTGAETCDTTLTI